MLILAVLLALVAMALDALVVVKLTLREGLFKGMLGLLFFPYAFYWGWKHRNSEDLSGVMMAWMTVLSALALMIVLAIISTGAPTTPERRETPGIPESLTYPNEEVNMPTFILLSKMSLAGTERMTDLAEMDRLFEQDLSEQLPEVKRVASYALLGAYDFIHIFDAPDAVTAAKVALLANRFNVSSTQTLTAIPFEEFKQAAEEVDRIRLARR